jgi:hypothetical protein
VAILSERVEERLGLERLLEDVIRIAAIATTTTMPSVSDEEPAVELTGDAPQMPGDPPMIGLDRIGRRSTARHRPDRATRGPRMHVFAGSGGWRGRCRRVPAPGTVTSTDVGAEGRDQVRRGEVRCRRGPTDGDQLQP